MMLLTVSPKSNREDRGYASILGYSAPGDVLLPARYSYAKYSLDNLVSYKGNYAYPPSCSTRNGRPSSWGLPEDFQDERLHPLRQQRLWTRT